MQFDPGMEYKPATVRGTSSGRNQNTQGSGVGGGGSNKDDNSWLLLCSALTDGPYSYIWTKENFFMYSIAQYFKYWIDKIYYQLWRLFGTDEKKNPPPVSL